MEKESFKKAEQEPISSEGVGEETLRLYVKHLKEQEPKENLSQLKHWCNCYTNAEYSFAKISDSRNISSKEFIEWEDDVSFTFDRILKYESELNYDHDPYMRDEVEQLPGMIEGQYSIEAYAGHFYDDRRKALIAAIRSSDNEESVKENEEYIFADFPALVGKFINARLDYELKRTDIDAYNENRRKAHNNVIRQINTMNELAEKYGVRRFIFRDIETNDKFKYNKDKDIHEQTNARAEYDRSSVEGYIKNAFPKAWKEAELGKGDVYYDQGGSLVAQFHSNEYD